MSGESLGREHYFATRHAKPARDASETDPKSAKYPDLTEFGVQQAREKARGEILDLVERAPEGAVIFIGGTSDQPRTKQTAEVYGDELKTAVAERTDVAVITKSEIDQGKQKGQGKIIRELVSEINNSPDKKVVVDYPLLLKQLAYKYEDRWTDAKGKKTEYFAEILKKHNNNHAEAGKDWIANQGKLALANGQEIQGPLPEKVAREYLQAVQRLHKFGKKLIPDRPMVVGEVGHQWDLDALVTYLGNNGKVDREGFERVTGGDIAKETELAEFVIRPEDATTELRYRGKEFEVPSEE